MKTEKVDDTAHWCGILKGNFEGEGISEKGAEIMTSIMLAHYLLKDIVEDLIISGKAK